MLVMPRTVTRKQQFKIKEGPSFEFQVQVNNSITWGKLLQDNMELYPN